MNVTKTMFRIMNIKNSLLYGALSVIALTSCVSENVELDNIGKEKGVLELVEAMNLLQAHTHIKLLVIGSSFYGNAQGEDDFTRTLKEKAALLSGKDVWQGFPGVEF